MPIITCIEDLRALAERRVPRMFYDYADSGSYTEGTYRANETDFSKIKLRQRVAVDMDNRTTRTKMIGEDVAMPVAIAPTGMDAHHASSGTWPTCTYAVPHTATKPKKIITKMSPSPL